MDDWRAAVQEHYARFLEACNTANLPQQYFLLLRLIDAAETGKSSVYAAIERDKERKRDES